MLDRSASRMLNSPGVPGLVRVPPECTENRWTQPRGCTPWWSRRAVARSGTADSLRFVRPSTYRDALASVPNDIPGFRVRTTDCGSDPRVGSVTAASRCRCSAVGRRRHSPAAFDYCTRQKGIYAHVVPTTALSAGLEVERWRFPLRTSPGEIFPTTAKQGSAFGRDFTDKLAH